FTEIRFSKGDATADQKEALKKKSNHWGFEVPVGFYFGASENIGVYLDINTKFAQFGENFKDSWREDFTLGLAFAL
ncbi:MAG TPA: hypothetical protein VEL47_01420, partial [Myxococcota bacterium]|nr:hypothetical protein [Myxococcota bacterium]